MKKTKTKTKKKRAAAHILANACVVRCNDRPLAQAGWDNSSVLKPFSLSKQTAELGRRHYFALEEARMSTTRQNKKQQQKQKQQQQKQQSPPRAGMSHESIPDCLVDIPRNELEVVFLGTGSAIPSKVRRGGGKGEGKKERRNRIE